MVLGGDTARQVFLRNSWRVPSREGDRDVCMIVFIQSWGLMAAGMPTIGVHSLFAASVSAEQKVLKGKRNSAQEMKPLKETGRNFPPTSRGSIF